MTMKKYPTIFAVGVERGKPIAIYDKKSGDVLAYIPNGKTKIKTTGVECKDCDEKHMATAQLIARLLNEHKSPFVLYPNCGRLAKSWKDEKDDPKSPEYRKTRNAN